MIGKLGFLALVACHLLTSTTADPVPSSETEVFTPIKIQKWMFDLFWHIDQPDVVHPEIYELVNSWNWNAKTDLYKDPSLVQKFLNIWKDVKLERGQIYSPFNEHHGILLRAFFDLLYNAKTISDFFYTAAWGRVHMNEHLFVDALMAAILRRPDTRNFEVPNYVEILPWNYFGADVMQQIYDAKMSFNSHNFTGEPIIIFGNYSNWYDTNTRDPETKLAYFREDVGLGYSYTLLTAEFPRSLSSVEYGMIPELRAQLYYFWIQTIGSIYNMHRFALGLHELESFDFTRPIKTGYRPDLAYRTGQRYPERPDWSHFPDHMSNMLTSAQISEIRLFDAMDRGEFVWPVGFPFEEQEKVYTEKGFNIFLNIIAGNGDSINKAYYGSLEIFFRKLFGFSPEPHSQYKICSSVLEHPATSLRDPAYYRIANRMLNYIHKYRSKLPAYTADQLIYKGITIDSATVDKLVTFFEEHNVSVSGAPKVHSHQDAEAFHAKVVQHRLNHQEFSVHLTIDSTKDVNAVLRIFIGPSYNSYGEKLTLADSYKYFYLVDQSRVELKTGKNKIEVKSTNFTFGNSGYESSDVFYQKILHSMEGNGELPTYENRPRGFAGNLMLPMGKPDGWPIQFFFFVSESVEALSEPPHSYVMGTAPYDKKPITFPLDRPLYHHNFTMPNMHLKTTYVFHEGRTEPNWKSY